MSVQSREQLALKHASSVGEREGEPVGPDVVGCAVGDLVGTEVVGDEVGERVGGEVKCAQSPGLPSSRASLSAWVVSYPSRHAAVSSSQPQSKRCPPTTKPPQSREHWRAWQGSRVGAGVAEETAALTAMNTTDKTVLPVDAVMAIS